MQPLKANDLIDVTLEGMFNLVIEEQPSNDDLPISFTDFGIETNLREEQPSKIPALIFVIEFGIATSANEKQPIKA